MLKSRLLLIGFVLLLFTKLRAEQTAGIATLYAETDFSNLIEIQAYTQFFSHPFSSKYEKVMMTCLVQNKQLTPEFALKKNARLYDLNGKKNGKCLQEFVPYKLIPYNDTCSKITIVALIDKASIDQQSIPELALAKIMQHAKTNVKYDFFKPFFQNFGFVEQDTCLGYVAFVFKQFNFSEQQFDARLMLVFIHNELIAIFHNRTLKIDLFDATEQSLGLGIIYNSKFTEHDKTKLMDVYKSGIHKLN